jgi:hypothetical protein
MKHLGSDPRLSKRRELKSSLKTRCYNLAQSNIAWTNLSTLIQYDWDY